MSALTIESLPGQPFQAHVAVRNAHPEADISCFTLQQPASPNPISLDYTILGNQQGRLALWSEQVIASPLTITLQDRCQPGTQTFRIQPDNTFSVPAPAAAVQTYALPRSEPLTTSSEEAMVMAPEISMDAYQILQQQIDRLQQDFKQLQAKSDTLYASNLAQADILTTLKHELVRLQNENHLLRTMVMILGLALIASGYFFADWLRRHAAVPNTARTREKSRQPAQPQTPPIVETEASPEDSWREATNAHPVMPPTQSPLTHTVRPAKFHAVPEHANDDDASPYGTPLKVSSQQSTQAVMQDASRLFTHGRVNQAIEHLQEHLAKHPKCSPWMWLYLLDLLSNEGKQQEFDIVASECRKHFNLSVERNPDPRPQGIESFPRIMKALQQTWGTPQVISLIDDLVYNTRLVPRMGFERSVFEELMLLKEIACQVQNLPTVPPAEKAATENTTASDNLRELQQLSGDIYILAPVDQTPFHYWTDFTFELDEPSTLRKSA